MPADAGTATAQNPTSLADAARRATDPQGLWALIPSHARARYLRRTAMAILDEVDGLAELLAVETGQPRTEVLLAELLPSVGGLHGLADDGPRALRDRRLGRIAPLRAGRRSMLVQRPVGTVGIRASERSAWAEPMLETAAALLAGNGVLLAPCAPRSSARLMAAFERAGVPEGLVGIVDPGADLERCCAHVVEPTPAGPKGTMLILDGAPLERTVSGALWAAYAGAGHGAFAIGRAVVVPSVARAFVDRMEVVARRLRVGDPRHPETEIGPLRSASDLETIQRAIVASSAEVVCGGPIEVPGVGGVFYAPAVLRVRGDDSAELEAGLPGPVLTVVEAADEVAAIEIAREVPGTVSVWAGDRDHGERVARAIGSDLAWVNDHGHSSPAAPVRLARHVATQQLASQSTRLRSARWLPYDPALVRAATASAHLMHGRESERFEVLRSGAWPLARTGARLLREALGR